MPDTAPIATRLAVLSACLLTGCEFDPLKALSLFPGREANQVVLSDKPVVLGPQATSFTSPEPMKVLGDWTSLCLSLKGSVSLQDVVAMERAFGEAMGGAKVAVHLTLSDGRRVALSRPLQAWRMDGVVAGRDELSACASMPCGQPMPVGMGVTRIDISSTPPLQVRGVFWTSERGPLEAPAPSSANVRTSRSKESSTCRA